jgi:hypothetical protein
MRSKRAELHANDQQALTVHQPPLFEHGYAAKPPTLLYRGSG